MTDRPCLDPSVPEDEEIVVAVNNVPVPKNIIIAASDETVADQSKAQAAFAGLGTDLNTATTAISPIAAVLPTFLSMYSHRYRCQVQ